MAKDLGKPQDYKRWLTQTLPHHERLAAGVKSLLENMLKKNKIEYLSVVGRVKNIEEAIEKIDRKKYQDPKSQLTDLSGIRVITYLEDHVGQISAVIKELFEIDKLNSLDRTEVLGDDKVGYRSTHFVCTLGNKRSELARHYGVDEVARAFSRHSISVHRNDDDDDDDPDENGNEPLESFGEIKRFIHRAMEDATQ
jgi:ppGpp synthetase/RelA/SpoT-type nucleotidyltranferase